MWFIRWGGKEKWFKKRKEAPIVILTRSEFEARIYALKRGKFYKAVSTVLRVSLLVLPCL